MEEHPLQHSNSNQKLPTTGPAAAAYHQWCRFILDLILFYTTAFFVLLAIVSLFALVFLVPFFIDPAWSTLQADFDPNGTVCTTLSGKYLKGTHQTNNLLYLPTYKEPADVIVMDQFGSTSNQGFFDRYRRSSHYPSSHSTVSQ